MWILDSWIWSRIIDLDGNGTRSGSAYLKLFIWVTFVSQRLMKWLGPYWVKTHPLLLGDDEGAAVRPVPADPKHQEVRAPTPLQRDAGRLSNFQEMLRTFLLYSSKFRLFLSIINFFRKTFDLFFCKKPISLLEIFFC